MVDEAELIKIIKENAATMEKNSLLLTDIRDDFHKALDKYDRFSEVLTEVKTQMKILSSLAIGIFTSLLVGLVVYFLK